MPARGKSRNGCTYRYVEPCPTQGTSGGLADTYSCSKPERSLGSTAACSSLEVACCVHTSSRRRASSQLPSFDVSLPSRCFFATARKQLAQAAVSSGHTALHTQTRFLRHARAQNRREQKREQNRRTVPACPLHAEEQGRERWWRWWRWRCVAWRCAPCLCLPLPARFRCQKIVRVSCALQDRHDGPRVGHVLAESRDVPLCPQTAGQLVLQY